MVCSCKYIVNSREIPRRPPDQPCKRFRHVLHVQEEAAEESGGQHQERARGVGRGVGLGEHSHQHADATQREVAAAQGDEEVEPLVGQIIELHHRIRDRGEDQGRQQAIGQDVEENRRKDVPAHSKTRNGKIRETKMIQSKNET